MPPTQEMAACGLDCSECDLRMVPFDGGAAQRIVAWFHEMKWLAEEEGVDEVIARGMYCKGCHGDRAVHWSADCAILTCCVDERDLSFCSECAEFPCTRLTERAATGERYAHALQQLEAMR